MKVRYCYLRNDKLYYCRVFLSITQSTISGPRVFRIELIILFCSWNVKASFYPLFLWWTWWAERQIFRAWTIPVFMGLKSFPGYGTHQGKAPANRVQIGHTLGVIIIICNWGNWGTEQQSALLSLPIQLAEMQDSVFCIPVRARSQLGTSLLFPLYPTLTWNGKKSKVTFCLFCMQPAQTS